MGSLDAFPLLLGQFGGLLGGWAQCADVVRDLVFVLVEKVLQFGVLEQLRVTCAHYSRLPLHSWVESSNNDVAFVCQ